MVIYIIIPFLTHLNGVRMITSFCIYYMLMQSQILLVIKNFMQHIILLLLLSYFSFPLLFILLDVGEGSAD